MEVTPRVDWRRCLRRLDRFLHADAQGGETGSDAGRGAEIDGVGPSAAELDHLWLSSGRSPEASISSACSVCQASTSGFAELGDLSKHVNAPEQDVDMFGLKDELSLLCLDEAVFHRVRHADDRHRAQRFVRLP